MIVCITDLLRWLEQNLMHAILFAKEEQIGIIMPWQISHTHFKFK